MNNNYGTQYTATVTYVDIDTGEILKMKDITQTEKFIIIRTLKQITYNYAKTKGHIKYTVECRRNPQLSFKF